MPSKSTYLVVAITAIITAIASVAVNEPIYVYLNRAKPHISATSVGFAGPIANESIRIPEQMVREISDSIWLTSLKNYEQFEKLVNYDKNLSVDIIKLEKAIKVVITWKQELEDKLDSVQSDSLQLNERELIRNVITKNEMVARTILHNLYLARTASPPLSLETLKKEFKAIVAVDHDSEKKSGQCNLGLQASQYLIQT